MYLWCTHLNASHYKSVDELDAARIGLFTHTIPTPSLSPQDVCYPSFRTRNKNMVSCERIGSNSGLTRLLRKIRRYRDHVIVGTENCGKGDTSVQDLSLSLSAVCLSVCLSLFLSVSLSLSFSQPLTSLSHCPSLFSVCLSVRLSLSLCLSVSLPPSLSHSPSLFSVCLSVYLSVCLSVSLSLSLPPPLSLSLSHHTHIPIPDSAYSERRWTGHFLNRHL